MPVHDALFRHGAATAVILLIAQVTASADRNHSESLKKIYSFPC
jgi:hypothetical protein